MSTDAILLCILLVFTLAGFVSGILRYDLVALCSLLAAVLLGLVPSQQAFAGFGHPAVITVAAVLVISRAFFQSGLVDVLAGLATRAGSSTTLQLLSLTTAVALMSAFMNNVGALALMMPVALKMAKEHGIASSRLLMPLAFGSLLGGLTTLIGTPPNIIVASYWGSISDEAFGLFSFTPVGLAIAVVCILFVALVGWRLLPERKGQVSAEERFEIESYMGELRVEEKSKAINQTLQQLKAEIEGAPPILAVVRNERRTSAHRFRGPLKAGDILLVEGETDEIETLANKAELAIGFAKEEKDEDEAAAADDKDSDAAEEKDTLNLAEAVVMAHSRLTGRSVAQLRLLERYGLNLIAVARQGQRLKGRLRDVRFRHGDVLLLEGNEENLAEQLPELGCLPLADRELKLGKPRKLLLSTLLFGTAIAGILSGWLSAPVALVACAALMILTRVLDLRSAYAGIDLPVIVLLGSMIPVGQALETTGGAAWLAGQLLELGANWPAIVTLGVLLLLTMFLSDIINNAAAAVLMVPISISLANGLEANPQPFLMAVAIGASCAFLTPIGHQSNTLVMGPGGYRFSDYWKLGLPVQIVVFAVALPMLVWVWPIY
ncbi:MAG: SLC13 family permease [Opitutales bacterium]|nr:SLC13 family permease [Opitutales bacterium]